MSSYLLDTNHVSAIHKRQLVLTTHPRRTPTDEFAIGTPTIGELWFMVFNSHRVAENTASITTLLAQFTIMGLDETPAAELVVSKLSSAEAAR